MNLRKYTPLYKNTQNKTKKPMETTNVNGKNYLAKERLKKYTFDFNFQRLQRQL